MILHINRRKFIAGSMAGAAATAAWPGFAMASAATDKRLVFIIQRGAADGLATVAPIGDPDFIRARGDLAQESLGGTKLDSLFALHPDMTQSAELFARGEASFVHALASAYRERSHFDAQNILESGASRPYGSKNGWLNRLLGLLPEGGVRALAVAPAVPLALRGAAPASSYEQSRQRGPDDDLIRRISILYAEDAQLSGLWDDALTTSEKAGMPDGSMRGGEKIGAMAAGLMAGQSGARVLMLETNGWDTHSAQSGRLGNNLKQTDALIDALRSGLGPDWASTLVLVATEFGRTVAFNGTKGTDHGTASAAMLFGGGLQNSGKVEADWPGLAAANLYEGRDLKPTLRFEQVVSAALAHHYGIEEAHLRKAVFPDFT